MSAFDVEPEEMTSANAINETLEKVLSGAASDGDGALVRELSFMVEQIQDAYPLAAVAPSIEAAHLANIAATVAEVARPAPVTAAGGSSFIDNARAWVSPLSRKVAAAALSFSTAFSGMAYAGALPDPVQSVAADLGRVVGLELPSPDEVDAGEREGAGARVTDDTDRDEDRPAQENDRLDTPITTTDRGGTERTDDDAEDRDDRTRQAGSATDTEESSSDGDPSHQGSGSDADDDSDGDSRSDADDDGDEGSGDTDSDNDRENESDDDGESLTQPDPESDSDDDEDPGSDDDSEERDDSGEGFENGDEPDSDPEPDDDELDGDGDSDSNDSEGD